MEKQIRHFLHFPLRKVQSVNLNLSWNPTGFFPPYPLLSSLYYLGFSSFPLYLDTTEIYGDPGKIL